MIVASTVAALGHPSDGTLGMIRVGAWPDSEEVLLAYNAVAGKWVSAPIDLVGTCDLNWIDTGVLASSANWAYYDGQFPQGWTALRTLRRAGELVAAGLGLQDRSALRTGFQGAGEIAITPWWYEFDDGDAVVFSNDVPAGLYAPSPESIGRGTVLTSHGDLSGSIRYFAADWTDVSFFHVNADGSLSALPATPTKKYLYPTLYAYNPNGAGAVQAAGYSYEARWVG